VLFIREVPLRTTNLPDRVAADEVPAR